MQNKKKIILSIFLIFSFYVFVLAASQSMQQYALFTVLVTLLAIGGVFHLCKLNLTTEERSRRMIISLIFIASIFFIRRTGLNWFVTWGLDPATGLFFSLLPLLWFLKVTVETNGLIALILLIFTAVFSVNKFDAVTENLAILAYFFLVTAVVQSIIELRRERLSYK